jgi:hypothetical protein
MVIELAVLFAIVASMGAIIVKVYEWRQDVLCGIDRARDRGDWSHGDGVLVPVRPICGPGPQGRRHRSP